MLHIQATANFTQIQFQRYHLNTGFLESLESDVHRESNGITEIWVWNSNITQLRYKAVGSNYVDEWLTTKAHKSNNIWRLKYALRNKTHLFQWLEFLTMLNANNIHIKCYIYKKQIRFTYAGPNDCPIVVSEKLPWIASWYEIRPGAA